MPLLTAGRDFYVSRAHSNSAQVLDSTHCYVAVGDSAAAFSAGHTDLQGTNKFRKLVDTVSVTGNVATYSAIFEVDEANFAWNEWGIANNGTTGLVNRKVFSSGTKTNGQRWVVTVTVTTDAP
jgi:hypothetical protein